MKDLYCRWRDDEVVWRDKEVSLAQVSEVMSSVSTASSLEDTAKNITKTGLKTFFSGAKAGGAVVKKFLPGAVTGIAIKGQQSSSSGARVQSSVSGTSLSSLQMDNVEEDACQSSDM